MNVESYLMGKPLGCALESRHAGKHLGRGFVFISGLADRFRVRVSEGLSEGWSG